MADEDAAERASQEIKALIRKLDPKDSSHKDRIRRLSKFRNFVTGEGVRNAMQINDDCRDFTALLPRVLFSLVSCVFPLLLWYILEK